MNPSFIAVWTMVLLILVAVRYWDQRRGNRAAVHAWSALAWVVFGMGLSRVFIWDPVVVQGASMLPTLSDDQMVVVDKRAFGFPIPVWGGRIGGRSPRVGDVVVFDGPDGDSWVKRVAAVSGDRVIYMQGRGWFRNGSFVAPPFHGGEPDWIFFRSAHPVPVPGGKTWEITVAPHSVFLLGDNPSVSVDSRHIGLVSTQRLLGRIP